MKQKTNIADDSPALGARTSIRSGSHVNPCRSKSSLPVYLRRWGIPLFAIHVSCGNLLAQPLNIPPRPPQPAIAPFPEAKPSRYEGGRIDEFVAEMSQKLNMSQRAIGPFGEIQDPEAKPAAKSSVLLAGRTPENSLSLSQVVERIQINTIMPREKRFLIGSRSISEGDSLPVLIQGKIVKLTVSLVSSQRIVFFDPATGESAQKTLSTLPAGMSSGSSNSSIPGMQRAVENAPLNLDALPEK